MPQKSGSTYVQLPDNSYLEVPAGVSDQEVHSRISGMFPDAFKSDPSAASPIPPPMYTSKRGGESPVSRNSIIPDMRKVFLNTGNPVPDRPGVDLLTKNGAGVARAIYSQTTPGVIHGLLKRFGVTQSGPDLMKETVPNAVATFAGGLEGAPEGGVEGGARPVERSGSNRPATRGPVPGRATPSKSTFGPMDAATLLPGMAGRAARLLQKFGVGQAETAAPQMAEPMADFGTPSHLRGQRVKAGTLTLDTGIPKSVRPEPAWKSQPANSGTPVESILKRDNSNQPTPESRAASDAAFNKLHPVSEFKSGMDPVAEATWQQSAFGQKPVEDIGTKVRAQQKAVPRTSTATPEGRAIDNQSLSNVMKGEDARSLSTSDLSSRLQEAAKSANKVKSGPDLLVKKMKMSDVGEINPHPRRYYPEQDISDEELGNTLGLKKKPAPGSQPEGPFKPGMGPGAMLKRGADIGPTIRPGPSTGPGKVLYHGTDFANIPSIREKGILSGGEGRDSAYLTRSPDAAEWWSTGPYAEKPYQHGGAVVQVQVPESAIRQRPTTQEAREFGSDYVTGKGLTAHRGEFEGVTSGTTIPPELIRRIDRTWETPSFKVAKK